MVIYGKRPTYSELASTETFEVQSDLFKEIEYSNIVNVQYKEVTTTVASHQFRNVN